MRYAIYGAGAVGGVIGGRLVAADCDVTLIARGAHLESLRSRGLELQSPDGSLVLPVAAAASPVEAGVTDGDVVILAMKGQDTGAALTALEAVAPKAVIVCAQNGVDNERQALRRFRDVYAMCVMLPAAHLEPGIVQQSSAPVPGILDLGRFPSGVDEGAIRIAADLESAGFSSRPEAAIMRQKYAKLLMNLGNAIEAACGRAARGSDIYARARAEGEEVLRSAGIDFASPEEDRERRGDLLQMRPIAGQRRGGGSSWQSLARGTGVIEADYLNGEIALLGRLHGIPTPVNSTLCVVANRLARERRPPGAMPVEELAAAIDAAVDGGAPGRAESRSALDPAG